ncbi:hypothetical protein BH20ACT9_BH20ACT9_15810 [soil metagenome]
MVTKHILAHVGVAVVGVGALLLFGVPTAVAVGLGRTPVSQAEPGPATETRWPRATATPSNGGPGA